ncbi:hypothetical protein PVAP13_3KG467700 [Panicum virgatum]|uniref:Uncharacterized protein n=1 Tax=Panicum virgatum TaxID=38727 RepID=A0A8T0UYZ2_PANVG|nr:hypothetical protein PVAP13_3KG467700 [Panicum virgatum]
MAAAADAVGRKSAFRRGLNATRVAVASAVTVLIVITVAHAVTVVFRPEHLYLSVTGCIITVKQKTPANATANATVDLTFSIQANNPSGRARFYYTDIRGLIFLVNNNNGTNSKQAIFKFSLKKDIIVAPDSMLQTASDVTAKNYTTIASSFDELYNGGNGTIYNNAMLKLNGTFTVGLYSVYNKTDSVTKVYYCWPLTIAGNASAPDMDDNVPSCEEDRDPTE